MTARKKWTKEVNKLVMKCFYKSDPSKRGYRWRMMNIWREIRVFNIGEQRLADKGRVIRTNELLSKVELEEIQREVEREKQPEEVYSATEDQHRNVEVEVDDEREGNGESILEEVELIEKISKMASREENFDRKTVLEQCVDMESNSLYNYVENSNERLLMAAKNEKILGEGAAKKEIYDKRKRQYKEKALHIQFERTTEEIKDKKLELVIKKGH